MTEHFPAPLSPDALRHLRGVVARIEHHQGPWGTVRGGQKSDDGSISMPWVDMDELSQEAMRFLYDHDLIIPFVWSEWDEGRAIFRDPAPDRFDHLDRVTVLKLLTAVARNDRFNAGAWTDLFEEGDGGNLFRRLLELEQQDSG